MLPLEDTTLQVPTTMPSLFFFSPIHIQTITVIPSVFSQIHLCTSVSLEDTTMPSLTTRKEGNVLFNGALNTFYLQLYGVGHMVKDHSDSERGNLLLFLINSKDSFICTIP